ANGSRTQSEMGMSVGAGSQPPGVGPGRSLLPRGGDSRSDSPRLDTLWIGAALAMACLAGCTYFLPVEGALAVAVALLILLFALADLRLAFLAFVAIYPFLSSTWGIDISEWMPYLTAKRLCCLVL